MPTLPISGDWLFELGLLKGTFAAAFLMSLSLVFYVLHRINDGKPVRTPTGIALGICVVASTVSGGIWLAQSLPGQKDTPQAAPETVMIEKLPSKTVAPAARIAPLPTGHLKSSVKASISSPQKTQQSSEEDYSRCGPPFYLSWLNLAAVNDDPSDDGSPPEILAECSAIMTENGYGKGFQTLEEALSAAAKANACAGSNAKVKAGIYKC